MLRPPGPCRRHRPLLAALVEHGERPPGIDAALEHMASCGRCEEELTSIALTVAALRRAGAVYRRLPDPSRATLHAPLRSAVPGHPLGRRRWTWRLQLGSLVTTAAIAALVVLPGTGLPAAVPAEETAPAHASTPVHAPGVVPWQAAELRFASRPDPGPVAAVVTTGTLPARYPDTMFRPWKEVPPSDATARGFEPR